MILRFVFGLFSHRYMMKSSSIHFWFEHFDQTTKCFVIEISTFLTSPLKKSRLNHCWWRMLGTKNKDFVSILVTDIVDWDVGDSFWNLSDRFSTFKKVSNIWILQLSTWNRPQHSKISANFGYVLTDVAANRFEIGFVWVVIIKNAKNKSTKFMINWKLVLF